MKRTLFGVLAIAAMIATLAAPLAAQSTTLTATIPFEFAVGSKTMPAGDYTISDSESHAVLVISGGENALTLTKPVGGGDQVHAGQSLLIFNRYGDRYVLSQVWDSVRDIGREVPMSKTERELSKTASVEKYEILALLAKR